MRIQDWPERIVESLRSEAPTSICDSDLRIRAALMLDAYLSEVDERLRREAGSDSGVRPFVFAGSLPAREFASGRAILDAGPEIQVAVLQEIVDRGYPRDANREDAWARAYANRQAGELGNDLARRKLHFAPDDVDWLVERIAESNAGWFLLGSAPVSFQLLLRSIERWVRNHSLSGRAKASLETIRSNIQSQPHDSQGIRALGLLSELLGERGDEIIDHQDDWGQAAVEALRQIPSECRLAWTALLTTAASIRGTRPSQKWRRETSTRIEKLGDSEFTRLATDWFAFLERPTRGTEYGRADGFSYPSACVADRNGDVLKGLAWACSLVDDEALTVALGDAALACYKKIPNYGARATKAGNACVHALAAIGSLTAIAQLQRVLQRVKLPSQRNQVEDALATAATARGLSAEDLEELLVPAHGLVEGTSRREFGEFTAELAVGGSDSVDLRWLKPDGKAQKSVPAQVKRDHAAEVAELKRTQKEIREALTAQRARIERLMLHEREWTYADWRERYLDHPLVGLIARRLLWTFEHGDRNAAGAWLDGEIVGLGGQPLDWLGAETRVRLWHPIESEANEVLAWREWLERHEVTQPFKQAHREIYVLTDAERETETYSNRFAAHILRQHQFNALCQHRGWHYRLQGAWDGFNVPTLFVPGQELRVEYWVEGIEQGDDSGLSAHGIYLYATTDQVRFADPVSGESLPLTGVPARIFSEVMRDVDLFVGVSSIGADPHWLDGGPGRMAGYQGYWWDFSFGDLTARAEIRREALARLLPRMAKLDGRWELDGRFLKVRGDLRSYKIHLGSGNILMEPNDQYLCIVPGLGAGGGRLGDGLFLPFEGDQTLSVILSKALMLAEDAKIEDPTITLQIA